jgi:hypothetical protein
MTIHKKINVFIKLPINLFLYYKQFFPEIIATKKAPTKSGLFSFIEDLFFLGLQYQTDEIGSVQVLVSSSFQSFRIEFF